MIKRTTLGQNINGKIGPVFIPDIGTKLGSIFGSEGRRIGEMIDSKTKHITIDFLDLFKKGY